MLIRRYSSGVKLIKPSKTTLSNDLSSVANSLRLPFNVCFMNTGSELLNMSEAMVEAFNFSSEKATVGKTPLDLIPNIFANRLIANNKNVMQVNKIKIIEENAILDGGNYMQCISVKSPWYDDNNKIAGIFCCAISLSQQDLDVSLPMIAKLGLFDSSRLNSKNTYILPGSKIAGIYLSQREMQCLQLCMRRKTAKETANILGLSHRTIEYYLRNIMQKLKVTSKRELIDKAMDYLY